MKNVALGCLLVLLGACSKLATPPTAKMIPHETEEFGTKRVDNYHWMRLSDEQKNSETPDAQTQDVVAYLNEENKFAGQYLDPHQKLQDSLYDEMVARIAQDDESVPYNANGYEYTTKFEAGKDYPMYYRKALAEAAEAELLLDVNALAEGQNYCGVGAISVSPDNKKLAYGTDYVSRRIYNVYFKNLETGEQIADSLIGTAGPVAWAGDNEHIYYLMKDPQTLRNDKIYRHKLGAPQSEDKLMYHEKDETFNLGLGKTSDQKYIVAGAMQTLSSEFHYIPTDDVTGEFIVFAPREADHEYEIDHMNGKFYVKTNRDGAQNYKLMTAKAGNTTPDKWKTLIPARKDAMIEGIALFNDYLVVNERVDGLLSLRVINEKDKKDYYISFPDSSYTAYIGVNREPDTDVLRYNYTSMLTPSSVIDFNMKTGESDVKKVTDVPGYNRDDYESERIWATVTDGTLVPIDVIYKKGFEKNGEAPFLLYAYGSYGNSMDPGFSSSIFSLLDRGYGYGLAHIRGGSEMGRQWYEDGKLLNKMNTFTDFNDCAQYLIDEDYTNSDNLFAKGGSAGGLLMGACINLQPELYKGVIANVPFVDVVSTMLDETIPLTTFEWDEWGDPRKEEYYNYMLSYSPYDNVEAKDYPNMLVTTGYWDSQVQYWEPAKWVAKLREHKTDDNLLLFKCDMESGHGGASGRFNRLKQTAMEFAFIISLTEPDSES